MSKPKGREAPSFDECLRRVTQAPGFGECTQLCDVVVLDEVCSQIPEVFHALRHGHSAGLRHGLRVNLYEPLMRYLVDLEAERVSFVQDWGHQMKTAPQPGQSHQEWEHSVSLEVERRIQSADAVIGLELEATLRLVDHLDDREDQFENGPWDEQSATDAEHGLRYAWYQWIASIACARIHFTLPREKARAHRHGAMSNKDGTAGRPADTARNEAIVAAVNRLMPSLGRNVWTRVAEDFGVSRTHVKNLCGQGAKKKTETKPAG
jgi:hypothetical protein